MKATFHLAQRFLERVLKKENYTEEELYKIYFYLKQVCSTIIPRNYKGYCVLPDNSNFVIAYTENTATTILPKEFVKDDLLYFGGKLSKKEYKKLKNRY